MAAPSSTAAMLKQLESARMMALEKPEVYNQFIPGFAQLIQQQTDVSIRRWGADFVAEAFSQPLMPSAQKESLVNSVVPLIRHLLEAQPVDLAITRSAIQAAASIYPLAFRRVCQRPDQALLWNDVAHIKHNILARMDTAPTPLRIMCIKFVQKVIQVQTPGMITDPRRPEQNEISLAIIPRNHPLLPLMQIEAETSGLVDRLLDVLQRQTSDPLIIDPTMNCLAVLIRTRPVIQNKLLAAVLQYNPFASATVAMIPRDVVAVRSLERTTRALLKFVAKILPQHPMREKIDSYLSFLQQTRLAVFSGKPAQKRSAEPMDGLEAAKRQRVDQIQQSFPAMAPPPNTLAHLFTLTEDNALAAFNVKALPEHLVTMIAGALMQHIDSKSMDLAIEEIRQRLETVKEVARTMASDSAQAGQEEPEYDPDSLNAATENSTAPALADQLSLPALELEAFELPRPEPLTGLETQLISESTITRIFSSIVDASTQSHQVAQHKAGLNRLAAQSSQHESNVTTLIRLATRASAGLDTYVDALTRPIKSNDSGVDENEISNRTTITISSSPVANRIREILLNYTLDDWRRRLPIALQWLTEEWYADRLATTKNDCTTPNYTYWATRLLDALLPRFDASDAKLLVRFASELPAIDGQMLRKLKPLFRDPATVKIGTMAMQYLYLMRPPVRDVLVDTMQEVWEEEDDEEVKSSAGKILQKWRPGWDAKKAAVNKMLNEADVLKKEETMNGQASRTYPNGIKAEAVSAK